MFNQRRAGVFELEKLFIALTKFLHKFSYGGEYILFIDPIGWTNIGQGLVKFMPSEARLEFF